MLKAIDPCRKEFIGQTLTQVLKKCGVKVISIDRKTGKTIRVYNATTGIYG